MHKLEIILSVLFGVSFSQRIEKEKDRLVKKIRYRQDGISEAEKIRIYKEKTKTGLWTEVGTSKEVNIRNAKAIVLQALYCSWKRKLKAEGFDPEASTEYRNVSVEMYKRWKSASIAMRNLLREEQNTLHFVSIDSYITYTSDVINMLDCLITASSTVKVKANSTKKLRVTRKIKSRVTKKYIS